MKLYYRYLQCKQLPFPWYLVRLDEQIFQVLSKYFSGKGGSAPLEKLAYMLMTATTTTSAII